MSNEQIDFTIQAIPASPLDVQLRSCACTIVENMIMPGTTVLCNEQLWKVISYYQLGFTRLLMHFRALRFVRREVTYSYTLWSRTPGAPGGPGRPASPFWPGSPLAPLVPGRPGVQGAPGSPFSPSLPSCPVQVYNVNYVYIPHQLLFICLPGCPGVPASPLSPLSLFSPFLPFFPAILS